MNALLSVLVYVWREAGHSSPPQGPGQYRWLYLRPGPGPLCSTAAAAAPAAGNICLS